MTNEQLEERILNLLRADRKNVFEVLLLIQEAERRKLHVQHGFPHPFDWLNWALQSRRRRA